MQTSIIIAIVIAGTIAALKNMIFMASAEEFGFGIEK